MASLPLVAVARPRPHGKQTGRAATRAGLDGLSVESWFYFFCLKESSSLAGGLRSWGDQLAAWGSGYNRVVADCERGGHPIPEWQELGVALRVVFRPHPQAGPLAIDGNSRTAEDQAGTKPGLSRD